MIRTKVCKISVGLSDGAVWYNFLRLPPRRLENKWRAHLTRDWHDRQGGKNDLCVAFWRKITHFLVDASDVSSYSVLLWIINDVLFKLVKSVVFSTRVIPIRITYRLLALLHRYNLWVTRRVGILQVYQTKYEVQQQSLWESKWFEYKAWLSASPIQSFGAWWETGSFLARWERWVIFLLLWVRYLFNSWMLFLSKEQYLLFCCLVQRK